MICSAASSATKRSAARRPPRSYSPIASRARRSACELAGGAKALLMEDRIGSFDTGCEADFVVLDPSATPLLARRMEKASTAEERLFGGPVAAPRSELRRLSPSLRAVGRG